MTEQCTNVRTYGRTNERSGNPPEMIFPVRYAHEDSKAALIQSSETRESTLRNLDPFGSFPLVDCNASRHGTVYAYRQFGCRCPDTTDLIAREKAEYRRTRYLDGRQLVPRLGTIRRVQALMAIGWSAREVARRAQYARPDDLLDHRRPMIRKTVARRVDAVFRELCMTPGPSPQVRGIARKRGYAPPLAWDDIDDPAETPQVAPPEATSAPGKPWSPTVAEYHHLKGFGLSDADIAVRLGMRQDSLRTALRRAGLLPQRVQPGPGFRSRRKNAIEREADG